MTLVSMQGTERRVRCFLGLSHNQFGILEVAIFGVTDLFFDFKTKQSVGRLALLDITRQNVTRNYTTKFTAQKRKEEGALKTQRNRHARKQSRKSDT